MKFSHLKHLLLAAVTTAFIIGCAGTTEEDKAGGDAAAAIAAAKAAYDKAKKELYAWRDTGKIIKKAEKALKDGKDAEALKLANKAREQAEMALQQKQDEMDRNAKLFAPASWDTAGSSGAGDYSVVKGDSLWSISGQSSVYGNPYQWPLIYKTNSDQIKDADLIYPGQNLAIDRNASAGDVDAAINHAKTRGAWSIGAVEASDKAYLAK